MSFIIKGMKMPKSCLECDMLNGGRAPDCFLMDKAIKNPLQRQDYCPLVEIPKKHGRLIDVDEYCMLAGCDGEDDSCRNCMILDCKTILESEE